MRMAGEVGDEPGVEVGRDGHLGMKSAAGFMAEPAIGPRDRLSPVTERPTTRPPGWWPWSS